MSPKQYDKFQKTIQYALLTILLSVVASVLLGVYALASLVF